VKFVSDDQFSMTFAVAGRSAKQNNAWDLCLRMFTRLSLHCMLIGRETGATGLKKERLKNVVVCV